MCTSAVILAAVAVIGAAQTLETRRDLQGTWDFATITPLERPRDLADKPFFTSDEARAYERSLRERVLSRMPAPEARLNADSSDVWTDWDGRVQPTLRTSLIIDPNDGRLPALTSEGRRRRQSAASYQNSLRPDDPEALPLATRCLRSGEGPPVLPAGGHNNYLKIVQTLQNVLIVTEMIHSARIVPIDGREHLPAALVQWSGDSRGRWDGPTLVIETTNFTSKVPFEGDSDTRHRVEPELGQAIARRVVERLTRTDRQSLLYQFTVDDPAVFTRPFTGELTMTQTEARMFEYACHEGNYGIAGVLRGARAADKERQP